MTMNVDLPLWLLASVYATYMVVVLLATAFIAACSSNALLDRRFGTSGRYAVAFIPLLFLSCTAIYGVQPELLRINDLLSKPAPEEQALDRASKRVSDEIARKLAVIDVGPPAPEPPAPPTPQSYVESIDAAQFVRPSDDRVIGHFPEAVVRVYPNETVRVGVKRYKVCDLGEGYYIFSPLRDAPEPYEPKPTPPAPGDAEG